MAQAGSAVVAMPADPEAPLRAELLSADRLADEARGLAAVQRWTTAGRLRTTPLLPLVERDARALADDNAQLARMAMDRGASSPAVEWLLDNYYLIEEQILLVRADLPPHYGIELPRLASGPYTDLPRVYGTLITLLSHLDARLDEEYLLRFVRAYQEVSALTIGEVWAIPIMLRIALVENLRRLSKAVVETQRAEVAAEAWAERLLVATQDRPETIPSLTAELDREPTLGPAFYLRLSQRIGDLEQGAERVNAWLEHRLSTERISLERAGVEHQQRQAADQVSIANSITSVRFLDAYDWRDFFESVSIVEGTLRKDPVATYAHMDFDSRDRYRHALETIAKRCPHSETELAERVVRRANEALAVDASDELKGHVGWWLVAAGRYEFEEEVGYRPRLRERIYRGSLRFHGAYYWGLLLAVTAVLVGAVVLYGAALGQAPWQSALLGLLAMIPLAEIAVAIVNRTSSFVFPPRVLPKLDHERPLAETNAALVVVPALLSSVSAATSVIENLEVTYLANRDRNLGFALLGDLRAGAEAIRPDDGAILEAAVRGISALNERYEQEHGFRPFHLLVRDRRFNESEGAWMGWERKRGALVELAREMRATGETTFSTKLGDLAFRRSCAFVITLDADTVLPRDGGRKLVSAIAHPMNRARWRRGEPRVRSGYGLLQPRVGMSLGGAERSRFASLYSGHTGIDPYAQAISDTYQDVFGEGSFTGKGIFEVDVFLGVLEGRFPENALLSHDLIEGSFLRTGLASDIEVLDDYPANYLAASWRLHRWVRGDWQTLPYLFGSIPNAAGGSGRNPLSALHRWKIVDNLRRSLVAPTTLLLFTLGWLLFPAPAPAWPLVLLTVILFPAYFSLAGSLVFRPPGLSFGAQVPSIARDFRLDTARALLSLATLPHQSALMIDAVTRALWRRFVSGKKLLEWETAADAEVRAGTTRHAFWRAMGPIALLSLGVLVLGTQLMPQRMLMAAPVAFAWLIGPFAAWWVSLPRPEREEVVLTGEERRRLRRIARKTWRFYETFVTAEGHHLAPDNYQEDPGDVVAWRTSPTNVGLQLLAYVAAHDLGFATIAEVVRRTSDTLAAMAGLERFRGHFYNWYDIKTLEPLRPAYVSTVDSGNLAGHLLTVRTALIEMSEAPIVGPQLFDGMLDAVRLALEDLTAEAPGIEPAEAAERLRESLDALERAIGLVEPPIGLAGWQGSLDRLARLADEAAVCLENATCPVRLDEGDDEPVERRRVRCEELCDSVDAAVRAVREPAGLIADLAPWVELLSAAPSVVAERPALAPLLRLVPSLVGLAEGLGDALADLDELAVTPDPEVAGWARALADGIRAARPGCVQLLATLRLDADIAREMWEHTDFKMLYDPHRHLFSIGYNLAEGHLDRSYYDLLASECRLASFIGIAKGDLPQEHWFRLGRALTRTAQGRTLVSWSASMFEYLMPLLVMRDWPGTLLDETYGSVVDRQIAYGVERGVPWGVSESAFNAKDAQLTYQYQAFGVPGLGLKRGLSDDIVIAPYAALLALPVAPRAVLANLTELSREGAEGRYGYYEALDYTPGRVPAGERRAVVKSFFAHHQGMAFVSLSNVLDGNRMQRRFHSDPMVASAELLLQERVPRHVQLVSPHVQEVTEVRSVRELPQPIMRSYPTADTPVPSTHFLSNGRYSVMVTNGGGGYSRWNGMAVTRYREDLTRDCWGTFFYLRDTDSGETFSAPHNPMPGTPDEYNVTFSPDKAEYRRVDGTVETRIEVAVSPEDDVEVRRIALTNRGRSERHFDVTSYFEIALTSQPADQAHKAFSNLFVETEAVERTDAVLFSRRPRKDGDERFWGLHLVACEQEPCGWSYETDRAAFLGRLRGVADPVAVARGGALGGSEGAVLDPCCALQRSVTLPPGETVRLVFATGVAETREEALLLTEKYHDVRTAQRAIDLAWTAAQLEQRDLGVSPEHAVTLDRLASRLLLTDPYSSLKLKTPAENGLQMNGLWSIGISGDMPILLVRVEELEHAPLVRQALIAHQYWRHKGLVSDLVIVNTRPTGYGDELDDRLRLLVRTGHALQLLDKPGGVFLRRADQMHPDVFNLLVSVARATLDGDAGAIELQINRRSARPEPPLNLVRRHEPVAYDSRPFARPELLFDNGLGGFDADTGEYVIVLGEGETTPAPWIDVLANPRFGCTVSEAGIGCTWALNSHENRLTTWNNDAVTDGSGELLYIRDEETGEYWSPTPLPVRTPEPYVIRHGRGAVRFEHETHGIAHTLDWFVASDDPVRVCRLRLQNLGPHRRSLSVTQLVEWVLGDSRSRAQQLVVTWYDAERDVLTAHNHYNMDFPGRCTFLASDRPTDSWTASRTEFIGRNGTTAAPAALGRVGLGRESGRYHDNCGAVMCKLSLEPGATADVSFLLGQTDTLDDARNLVDRYRRTGAIERARREALGFWDEMLGAVQVETPDKALDLMVNGQLLYQATACRLWGRTATYQSSGAFGFRDQLQDVMGLLTVRPDLVREQIIEASRHQFPEGDVLHWWQPFSGRGVRTHISDDRHWLPLVVAEYLEATGDESVLDEMTAFIEAAPLPIEAEDAYVQPAVSEMAVSVYEHCIRAIEVGRPVGAHGLPLMGGGDWNDGMNRVGHEGKGESVWMAWFLGYVLKRFAPVCASRGEHDRAEEYGAWAHRLAAAAEEHAWDGAWYRRAFFDDGTPLGTHEADECRIDAIAQAWAAISGLGDPERTRKALDSVEEKLVRREAGLIALLSPPFDRMAHDPGYIKGYVPGVRENGGQYTHAALWTVLAYLLRGDGGEALSLLQLINPVNHALDRRGVETYRVEPYVVAADVYAVEPHTGRGGWTWYTGSASWFYRVALTWLLGFRVAYRAGTRRLIMNPCIPQDWDGFRLTYRDGATTYNVRVENPRGVNRGVARVMLDGQTLAEAEVPLTGDGREHDVVVTMLGG